MKIAPRTLSILCALTTLAGITTSATLLADDRVDDRTVKVKMFAPEHNHRVGLGGRGWFVDLEIEYDVPLERSGFTVTADGKPGFQLTGPDAPASGNFAGGVHNNANPFPGTFSLGADDRLLSLIVLLSTTQVGAGSCQNIAKLFNLTGVTDLTQDSTELWDTWIVGAPNFGVGTDSRIFVAVADDMNGDGIFNDAPDVLPDANGDGQCDISDLERFGIASNIETVRFFINP